MLNSKPLTMTLNESGTARILLSSDLTTLTGILTNLQEEVFHIYGSLVHDEELEPKTASNNVCVRVEGDVEMAETSSTSSGDEWSKMLNYNIEITELETDNKFHLRGVRTNIIAQKTINDHVHRHYHIRIENEAIKFETEEVLVGSKADLDLKNYFGMGFVDKSLALHIGIMCLNIQPLKTPPPTPSSIDGNEPSIPSANMEIEDDYMK